VDEIGCLLVVNPRRILHANGGQTDADSTATTTAAKGINNGEGFGHLEEAMGEMGRTTTRSIRMKVLGRMMSTKKNRWKWSR
jgi:hypothetical protein